MRADLASFHRCLALFAAAVALLSGCMSPAINDPARVGPFYAPRNVSRAPTLAGIRRVLLLPIYADPSVPEASIADLDPVFRHALQEQNRFEVVTLSRDECRRRFGASAFSSAAALPHDFFPTLRRVYAADGVLFVDLTVFQPYHPLALGIRAKLAVNDGARLLWTFDNVFSGDDPLVSAGARHFYLGSEHQDVPGDLTPSVLQSPSRFAGYAAYTTFATLPPVTLGQFTETSKQHH